MQLNKITDQVYYLDGAVNIGVIRTSEHGAIVIDTGLDESAGRKVKKLLDAVGLKIEAIIITHAHADHYGGTDYLVKATSAPVYASRAEKSVLETPLLEPVYLFGGAYPPLPLCNKFFQGASVHVDHVLAPGTMKIAGQELEIVDLKGHSLEQIGVAVAGVLCCADAVIDPLMIKKHGIPLNTSIGGTLSTYEYLEGRGESLFLPSHGTLVADVKPLVAANRESVERTLSCISRETQAPCTEDEITAKVCESLGLVISNMGQYYLMRLTIAAYLGYLLDQGEIGTSYKANRQHWGVSP